MQVGSHAYFSKATTSKAQMAGPALPLDKRIGAMHWQAEQPEADQSFYSGASGDAVVDEGLFSASRRPFRGADAGVRCHLVFRLQHHSHMFVNCRYVTATLVCSTQPSISC